MYINIHVPYEHFSEYPSDGEVLHQNHFEANVGAPGSVERGQFTYSYLTYLLFSKSKVTVNEPQTYKPQ